MSTTRHLGLGLALGLGQWLAPSTAAAETPTDDTAEAAPPREPRAADGAPTEPTPMDRTRALLAEGHDARARALLVELAERNDPDGDVYLYLGSMERSERRLVRAIAVFEAGVAHAPTHVGLLSELAMTYAWAGRMDDALATYAKALALAPDDVALQLSRARVLVWAGEHQEALQIYDARLAVAPSDLEALRGAAFLHRSRLRPRKARALYERALAVDPDDTEARRGLEELAAATRWQLSAAAGIVSFIGSTALRGEGGLTFQATPEVMLRGTYTADVPTGAGATAGDSPVEVAHVPSAGVVATVSPRVTVDVATQARLQGGDVTYRLPLRASVRASETLVALAGVRPGVRRDGRPEVLGDVGLQWLPLSRLWLMAQGFYFTNADRDTSWTAVGTVWAQPAKVLALRAGGGGGAIGTRPVGLLFAGSTFSLGPRVDLSLSYEYLRGPLVRHAASVGLALRF